MHQIERITRSNETLADILFDISVNFLMYTTLIIVFYMLVRFYLEEETSMFDKHDLPHDTSQDGYMLVSTKDDEDQKEVVAEEIPQATALKMPQKLRKTESFLNINEWGEPEGTRQEVIVKIVICAIGLIISFCFWGLLQERILTQTYDGEYFEFSYGLVFMNRLGGLLLSIALMHYFKVEWVKSALWEYSFPAVANMLSSWCQYEALKYVAFPVAMLAKALKMIPIMFMGYLMNNKSYELYEYVSAVLVFIGIFLFLDSSEHLDIDHLFDSPEKVKGSMCGVVLLVLFLGFDSFTGQWQTRMFQLNKAMSPLQMMLIMNAYSAVFSLLTLIHQEELWSCFLFVYAHPQILVHLLLFCICAVVGQLFIYYTVKNFGAVVFAIIMSVRLLFSTLLSCAVYSHPITELGTLGMIVVFGAIAYRIKLKTEGKHVFHCQDHRFANTPAGVLSHWHEHLDI